MQKVYRVFAQSSFQHLPISRWIKYRQVVSASILLGDYGRQIVDLNVEKKRSQDWSLWETIFQASEPAWLAVTSGQGEPSVPNKFHDHLDHVLVQQKFQQLAGEATVPDSVMSSCQIDKHRTGLLFCLKRILKVLRKQNDLVYGRLSMSKSSLFLWKQWVDYWFDTIVDQSFEDFVMDKEEMGR